MTKGGFVKWSRQTTESDIFFWRPPVWFKIWFYIVVHVNFADTKQFKRGEGFFTYDQLRDRNKATRNQVKSAISWLRGSNMIATRRTTRGVFITVLNYAKFQDKDDGKTPTQPLQNPYKTPPIREEGKKVRRKEVSKTICDTPSAVTSAPQKNNRQDEPMTVEQFITWTSGSPHRHIQIIAEWARATSPPLTTYGQWQGFISRYVKAAKKLVPFTDDQIIAGYQKMKAAEKDWLNKSTLETLYKFVV